MDNALDRVLDEIEKEKDPLTRAQCAEKALSLVTRVDDPERWAALQGVLGAGLVTTPAEHWDEALCERVVAAYQAALTVYTADNNPKIWAETWGNVGATHLTAIMHRVGDAYEHAKAAKVAYGQAMSLPPERLDPEIAGAFRSEVAAVDELLEQHERFLRDPFNLAEQAAEEVEALRRDAGVGPRPTDTDVRYPAQLNEEIAQLLLNFRAFFKRGVPETRTATQRSALELSRWAVFTMAFEHLTEKYEAAERTRELFAKIRRGETGFVLFLRGFAMREQSWSGALITVGEGASLEEGLYKRRLVADLAPQPVVWIANPVDSGPLELVMMADGDADKLGYRVEVGVDWEAAVHDLVNAATSIVCHNPVMTPGVAYEIALVESLDRLDDSFFADPKAAMNALNVSHPPLRLFSGYAIDQMRQRLAVTARCPVTALPAPTCRWLEGAARSRLERLAARIDEILGPAALEMPKGHLDLALDGRWAKLASLVLLEDPSALAVHIRAMSDLMAALDETTLEGAHVLARGCSNYATALERALQECADSPSAIDRTIDIFSRVTKPPSP